jgi:hypothetical protein
LLCSFERHGTKIAQALILFLVGQLVGEEIHQFGQEVNLTFI